MTTLFISDIHIDPERPDITGALLDFLLQEAMHCDALYIIGDLFEAWIGDDDDSPLNQSVIDALRAVTAAGVPLTLMHGNRDFLLGDDFAKQVGGQLIHEDYAMVDLYGSPALIMHGDTLCIDDQDYMAFRSQCRSPQWQAVMLAKPLAERRMIAEQMRQQSKQAMSNKADAIMDVNADEVVKVMQQQQTQLLIHGHTHRPGVHDLEQGQRVVLGDWDEFGWVLRYQPDNRFTLDKFPIASISS